MRKTTEILRLKHEVGLTHRQIARSCGLTHPTVSKYLERAQRAGLVWPLPEDVDEEQLQALLFPETDDGQRSSRPLPDMEHIHKELRRAHMTLQLLWEEYRDDHPNGYSYTQFCEHYKRWKAPLEVTLRQRHVAGEKTFLDWAGKTMTWTDPTTGELHTAYLFVAVLGASSYTFAEAFADQKLILGSRPTSTWRNSMTGSPGSGYLTTPRPAWSNRAITSRRYTTPIKRWPIITARRSCRHALTLHATKPRWNRRCSTPSAVS